MSFDTTLINEQVNAFWGEYGYVLIAGTGVVMLALVMTAIAKIIRSRQRDR